MTVLIIVLCLALLFVISVYAAYRYCFGEYREKYPEDDIEQQMPKGPAYEVFREAIEKGIRNVIEAKEYELVNITSVDGLKLYGR